MRGNSMARLAGSARATWRQSVTETSLVVCGGRQIEDNGKIN